MADRPHFPPCPDRPNCVSTEAEDPSQRMEAIPFSGSAALAVQRLAATVEGMAGGVVKRREGNRLHCEFTSRVLRFVDDVDLLVDEAAGVIHFRSASRQGHWDLGANRRRMKELRRRFDSRG